MEDFKIDPSTGLPELPEGQYWEVRKPWSGTYTVYTGPYHTLHIRRDVTLGAHYEIVDRRKANPKYNGIFGSEPRYITVQERVQTREAETATEEIAKAPIMRENKEAYQKAMEKWRTQRGAQLGGWVPPSPDPTHYADFELSEELILETAKRLLRKLAKQQAQDRLVGKYPPNKLGA